VSRFNRHFEIISTLRGRIAFASFEYFDVASLHLLTIQFYRAEGNHYTLSTRRRSRRARRIILEHSHEIIFKQRTRLNGLKKKQGHKHRIHILCAFRYRCRNAARSVQQGSR
jgi:hypothetical protein